METLDGYLARFLPARQAAALVPFLVLLAAAWASPVSAGILLLTLPPFILALALAGDEPPAPEVYPHPIAWNVLGGAGNFAEGDDYTDEERKMMFETRKILGDQDIAISVTCARVPVPYSHSLSVNLQTRDDLSVEDARALIADFPGCVVVDDPASHGYPTPRDAAGRDEVFVGRIRRDPSHPRAINLWVVSDNLYKGAATNAVQLAEQLHARGLVGTRTAAV